MGIKLKAIKHNFIPPMEHPLGKHWGQPDPKNILIDDQTAIMSQKDFNKLAEYSSSSPSGVYPGKMWKAKLYREVEGVKIWGWYLRWFGLALNMNQCSNNSREIIIVD